MIKTLYVAGTFDDEGGTSSKIGEIIFDSIKAKNVDYFNGGFFWELEKIIEDVSKYNIIYWFANVRNDKSKLVREIKKVNKRCILVTSKRNINGKYGFNDLIYRAFENRSNLLVEFSKNKDKYQGRVIDPLGNVFLDNNNDFALLGRVLGKRVTQLLKYTRVPSESVNSEKITAPNENEFYNLVKEYGQRFHNLTHPQAVNRFLGNASFRDENGIYMSRRNIDKRSICRNDFVKVLPRISVGKQVHYLGSKKPSVDTPIQIRLYNYYPNIRYILHGHFYVNGAPFTEQLVPCGAIEEADEIFKLIPDGESTNFAVNLRGHGSLIIVDDVGKIDNFDCAARIIPEVQDGY